MAIAQTTHSDEEIIKRLQIVMRDLASASLETGKDLVRVDGDLREVRTLAADLAGRIHAEPGKWGIAELPPEVRDEAVRDAFVSLLRDIGSFRGQQPVADWFASTVREQAAALQALRASGRSAAAPQRDGLSDAPPVFASAPWQGFEQEFPKEALALRLRYLLDRTPDEMAPLLEASTPRAVTMRLNRARDRFEKFCRESGLDVREMEQMLQQLGEGGK